MVPNLGDTILVLKKKWLRIILSGEKTMEIRNRPLREKRYWLGCKGTIYASIETSKPIKISSKKRMVGTQ